MDRRSPPGIIIHLRDKYCGLRNHYHVVLHINRDQALSWSTQEVCEHWHELFSGNDLSSRYLSGEDLTQSEEQQLQLKIDCWRERLIDISWFMRCLNEPIARQANQEDKATGRFYKYHPWYLPYGPASYLSCSKLFLIILWEGRFKSQALLDEKALAACMAYVDLNPIRSRMAETPETSDHTSIQQRIKHYAETSQLDPNAIQQQPADLLPFAGNPRRHMAEGLPFRYTDYLELVDWSGRILRDDKKGAIPANTPEILSRLNIDSKNWIYLTKNFESPFKSLVGSAHQVRQACEQLGKRWVHGLKRCGEIFPDS